VNCEQKSSVFEELLLGNSHGRQLAVESTRMRMDHVLSEL
jgi:hypothetical protein